MYISDKVYDVVVVGAGNAGLMAALKLQKKVLTVKSFASKNFQVLCPLRDST